MMNWINKKRNKKGFTLVELVVVIAILGILAAVAVPKLGSSRTNAAISAHNANVRTLESAATLYIADGGKDTTWTSANKVDSGTESDIVYGWDNYIQEWPGLPELLKDKTLKSASDGSTDVSMGKEYTVTISNGSVTVLPGKVK